MPEPYDPRVDNDEDDDDNNEVEDDFDDEVADGEDDEVGGDGKSRKRRRLRRAANPYIDDAAVVDEDESDELSDDEYEADLDEPAPKDVDLSNYRKVDSMRHPDSRDFDAVETAKKLVQIHMNRSQRSGYQGDSEYIAEHMLLPSIHDPSVWLQGREQDLCLHILRKYTKNEFKDEMAIMSAFTRENLPGYIYIEAKRMGDVQRAIENVSGIYTQTVKVVPIDDMVASLRIKAKDAELRPGAWVRMKKGKYAGDLAKVQAIVDAGSEVRVKLVPRVDFSARPTIAGGKRRKGAPVQPQKLFHPDQAPGARRDHQRNGYMFNNEFFDRDGYLEKDVKIATIDFLNINPTLEEISKFSGGLINQHSADLSSLAAKTNAEDLGIGENVEVVRGEMKDSTGKVSSLENGIATVITQIGPLKFDVNDLRKRFDEGDHVKVMSGSHAGETGLVIKILNSIVTLLSDSTLKPVGASDIGSGVSQAVAFDVYDFIQITQQDFGVVIKIENDMLSVINQFGNAVKLKAQHIMRKIDTKRAITSDSNGRAVSAGDMVVISDSSAGSRRGTVLCIFRSFVFVQSREAIENGGIFVAKNSTVSLLSGTCSNISMSSSGDGAGRFTGGRRPRRGGDPLISKTVTITGGPNKGYIGIVMDVTSNGARVELHTDNRTVNVDPAKLQVHGSATSHPPSDFSSGGGGSAYGSGSMTPLHPTSSARTPMHPGSKTPMHRGAAGGRTPNPYDGGSRTPAWDSGSRTPAYGGGRTPAWEAGSRTPAWESGSRTPGRDAAWDAASGTSTWSSSKGILSYPSH
ncbi:transcription elongation factor spt5 [Cladochytrium tenue]|nr:transcription elongation factor spt5 [Cladochytrium tenue]